MKLTPIAANRNIVTFNDGTEVFFSYETPVAGYSNELGYISTKKWYSSTTTRHINKYMNSRYNGLDCHFTSVDQDVIDNLVSQSQGSVT
jgi:hypothetical protein